MSKRVPEKIKDGSPLKLTRSHLYRFNKKHRHADLARLEVLRNNGTVKKKLNNSTGMKKRCKELDRDGKAVVKESNKSNNKGNFTEKINPKNSPKVNIRKRLDELFQKELHNVRKKFRQCEKEYLIKRNNYTYNENTNAVKYDQCDEEDLNSTKRKTYNQNTAHGNQKSVISKSLLSTLHDSDEILPHGTNLCNEKEYNSKGQSLYNHFKTNVKRSLQTEPSLTFTISSEKNLSPTEHILTHSWHKFNTSAFKKYIKVPKVNQKLIKIFEPQLSVINMSYKQQLGSEQIDREKIYAYNRYVRSHHLKKYVKELMKYIQSTGQKAGDTLIANIGSNSEFFSYKRNKMKSELKALMSQYFSIDYKSTTSSSTKQSNANVLMQNIDKKIAVNKQEEEICDEYCTGEMSDEYCEEEISEVPCEITISTQVLTKNEASTSYESNEELDSRHQYTFKQKGSLWKYDGLEYERPKWSNINKLYRNKNFIERSRNDTLRRKNNYEDFEDVETHKDHINIVPKVYDPNAVILKHLSSGKRESNAKYIYSRVNPKYEKTNNNEGATRNIKDINKQKRNTKKFNIPVKVSNKRHSHEYINNGEKKKETKIRMLDKDQVPVHKVNKKETEILRKNQMYVYNNTDRQHQNRKKEHRLDSITRYTGKYTREHVKRSSNQYKDMCFSYKLDKDQNDTACYEAKICKKDRSKHSKIYTRRNGLFDSQKALLEANKHTKEINKKKCSYTYVQKIVASQHKNYNRSNIVEPDIVHDQMRISYTSAKNKQAAVKGTEELSMKPKSHKKIAKTGQLLENNNGSQSNIYQKPNKMMDSVRKLRKNQNNRGLDVMMKQTYIKLINRELCKRKQLNEVFHERQCILKGFESEGETINYLSGMESGKNFAIQNQLYEYPNNNRRVGELKIDENLPLCENINNCDTSQSDEFEKYQVFALHDRILNKKKLIPAKLVNEENYKKVLQNLYKDNSELRCKIKKLGKIINERIFHYPAKVQEYNDEIRAQTDMRFEEVSNYSSTFELGESHIEPLLKKYLEKQKEKKEGIKVKRFAALLHKT